MYADMPWSCVISKFIGAPSSETLVGCIAIPVMVAWKERTVTPVGGVSCRERLICAIACGAGGAVTEELPTPQPISAAKLENSITGKADFMTPPFLATATAVGYLPEPRR